MRGGKETRARLRELDVRPTKQRGQNFVTSPPVLDVVVNFLNPLREEHVVEIGGGLGALTAMLLPKVASLTVVEIDRRLAAGLRERFPSASIVEGDGREVDLSSFGEGLTIVGNLPYSFSTEITFHVLAHGAVVRRAVFLLQKEFVDRMGAQPGSKEYGVLSIMVQRAAAVRPGPLVKGGSFFPPTKVTSRLVELVPHPSPRWAPEVDAIFFRRVVQAAFSSRRRMISNSLRSSFTDDAIARALAIAGIAPELRAEQVDPERFGRLAVALRSSILVS